MAKTRTIFRCMECGHSVPKWSGQCSGCMAWNTLVEEIDNAASGYRLLGLSQNGNVGTASDAPVGAPNMSAVQPLTRVSSDMGTPLPTGIAELDRVLGGGLVPGSVTLLGGEPGIGKSTLVLEMLASKAREGAPVLYVTGEESAGQVRLRAERLRALEENIGIVSTTSLSEIMSHMLDLRPHLCVIDSIQTLHSPQLSSAPGSVGQVRECANQLVAVAKATSTTVVLVGHVTKDGNIAGPRTLEHIVDTVLSFEGDRHNILRTLRANKHRFGSTEELGLFTMAADGLVAVDDPSGLFLGDRRQGSTGSVIAATLQGHRPLLVEVQTLAANAGTSNARRSTQGMDANRLALLLAVIESSLGISTHGVDIYANVVGGVRLAEPGADLAVCLSVISTMRRIPVNENMVACGEVGLGGELRSVAGLERRLAEAARLGFTTALVPESAPWMDVPITVLRMDTLEDALDSVCLI
ncbi:MAG: DNA repair protein RadA [Microthrixaceae bacterium]